MDFTASINLMRLKGAQCLDITLADGKTQRGIFIPAAYNDMVRSNKQTGAEEVTPYVNLRVRTVSAKFVESCMRNHMGEDGYRAPSHTVDMSFSKDFRERAIASASKRIAAERAAAGQPPLSDTDLLAEAKHAVYITLGTMTPVEQQAAAGYQPSAAAVAQAAPMAQFNTPSATVPVGSAAPHSSLLTPHSSLQSTVGSADAPTPIDDLPF